jgi:dCTP deaminase
MILTGSAISDGVRNGDITIDPFDLVHVNPNSYNYRLGMHVYRAKADGDGGGLERLKPSGGRYLLRKRSLYLGHTFERIGSARYVTSLIGRSSIGRLGLFVQVSANLGHTGVVHRWTLELLPAMDIYVYPGQVIGQVSFWATVGEFLSYTGFYGRHDVPMPSKLIVNTSAGGETQ